MCGIAGFIAGHGAANAAALAPMLARIAHRGPDGQGTFVEGPAALGHCRLAIIDLEGGAQPLYSEDKNLVVVFNGEIYNYRALTAELTALGHTFATRTDTEVLLHGWEQWGRELLPRLRGMFAFALWDRRAGVLFCARDMFGIKPLYYCRCADGTLLFASEIKAFLDHPSFAKRLNTAQLPLYLSCQYSPGRDTFFAGVQKLLPGHFLEFSDGIVRTTRWVQPAFLPGDTPVSPAEIEEVLRGSAAAHKVADVEVAGFLSGGVVMTGMAPAARATVCASSFAPPKCPDKSGTAKRPASSIATTAESVAFEATCGAIARTAMPAAPTNRSASDASHASAVHVRRSAFPSPNPRETETSQPGSSSPVCAQSESARAVRCANAYPLSVNAMQEILI